MSLSEKFGIPASLLDAAKKTLAESEAYQQKVKAHMAKKGVKSLNDLSADQKKKFFNELDAMHTAKHEEVEEVDEAQSHAAKTTMKHIDKPTEGEKEASKKIKPGIAGYRDRIAMLHSAKNRGALKKEDLDSLEDLTDEEIEEFMQTEEYEQLDELSKKILTRYANTAASSARHNMAKTAGAKSSEEASKAGQTATQRLVGYHKALKKIGQKNEEFDLDDLSIEDIESFMQTEDYNQLDELSKNTLASYIKKRSNDVATMGAVTRKYAMDSDAKKKEHGAYTNAARELDQKSNKAFMKGWKHRQNIGKAVDKLTKEELEFIESLNAGTAKE